MLFATNVIFASTSYYCPKTGTLVSLGQSMSAVAAACGKPPANQISITQTPAFKQQRVWAWTYDYKPNAIVNDGEPKFKKKALEVDFVNLKVIAIRVEGQSVQSTKYCSPERPIKIGDTNLAIRQLCELPTITKYVNRNIPTPSKQVETWTYQSNDYLPSEVFTFEGGRLSKISP